MNDVKTIFKSAFALLGIMTFVAVIADKWFLENPADSYPRLGQK